jgi:peptide/nickel transport system permease protein
MRRAWSHPSLVAGAVLGALLLAVAVLSFVWTPHDPGQMRIALRLRPPDTEFWLGTDPFGRDVASMLMVGARHALLVGLVAVGIGLVAGVTLGMVAARHQGGLIDEALMRGLDVVFAFPAVLTAILILTFLGPGLANAMLAIGIFNVPVFARQARAAAMQVMAQDYIRAARLAGCGSASAPMKGLAYLGLGTQPPAPSWGRMLNEAQTYLSRAPLLAIFPGAAIALAVLAFNLLGDGLRDQLDPRREAR